MSHVWIFVNTLILASLLVQAVAIRWRYGHGTIALLKQYQLCVLAMGVVFLYLLVDNYLSLNYLDPALYELALTSPLDHSQLGQLPQRLRLIYAGLTVLSALCSPAWLVIVMPDLFLAILDYEAIALSRRQKHLARLTKLAGWIVVVLNFLTGLVNAAVLLAGVFVGGAGNLLFAVFSFSANTLVYGSLLAWALHAAYTRVFLLSPLIRRSGRAVMAITAFSLVLILFQLVVRQLRLILPLWLEPLSGQGAWTGIQPYWLLAAAWGGFGVMVLEKTLPQSAEGLSVRDPLLQPLPQGEELRMLLSGRGLSERECQVAVHILDGSGNKEIAELMGISYNTVKNHVASIFRKLGTSNRFELTRQLRRTADPAATDAQVQPLSGSTRQEAKPEAGKR